MTDHEWLSSTDPLAMLEYLREHHWPSDRKLRLFAVACYRQVWDQLTDERSRRAVEVAERFADGLAAMYEFNAACIEANAARKESPFCPWNEQTPDTNKDMAALAVCNLFQPVAYHAANECRRLCSFPGTTGIQAALLRDIFGNPFRLVARWTGDAPIREGWTPFLMKWLTPTVLAIAETIYHENRWDELPILADALEEAGATCQELLDHCRQTGPHVKGCWVVDLLLGKE